MKIKTEMRFQKPRNETEKSQNENKKMKSEKPNQKTEIREKTKTRF